MRPSAFPHPQPRCHELQMHPPTTLHPGCKVNIYLDIRGRQTDGLHQLLTLFLPLPEPHDTLIISPGPAGTGFRLTCRGHVLDETDNILLRVYKAFSQCTKTALDLDVQLTKKIPVGAGLGGGSSDAAAFLKYLNSLSQPSALSEKSLLAVASAIGADVPFLLSNQPAWAENIGDVLHPAAISLAGLHSVVVCPDIRISTAWAYQAWDKALSAKSVAPQAGLLTDFKLKDIFSFWPYLFFSNAFEHVVFPTHPHLRDIKENLLACGAAGVVLSGSGASLFAIFRNPRHMEKATHWMSRIGLDHYKHSW